MSTVLIVDPSKPSLVMSSEVFKDKIPGITVLVAASGQQALEIIEQAQAGSAPDLCVVDFDLPDTDGITLIHLLRKNFDGPILLTAYPDDVVKKAVAEELFAYDDAGMWIRKPVRAEDLNEKIDRFLVGKFRVQRRFDFTPKTRLLGKSAGRGKRTPKFPGQIVNISVGGACVQLSGAVKFKIGDEVSIELPIPKPEKKGAETAQIKSQVVWRTNDGKRVGITFDKLSDPGRKGLERLLKQINNSIDA
ncbi:MAG: response regulator [Proteobacteria bacterium]|nr:response regulator [Pseudomonadota bacterium]